MKRILLATITENDQCSSVFANSLANSVRAGFSNDVEILPVFFKSSGNWAMAANQAMTLCWEHELDGLVLINPSVSWHPDSLIDLCKTDKDAASLPVATPQGFDILLGEMARLQEDEKTKEIKVLGTSLDFIYLSQYTLQKLCDSHPTVSYHGQNTKLILQSGDIYASYHTHAEVLSHRLRELGIEQWVYSSHTAHRYDPVEYQGDFASALKEMKDE
jgi:hypothetical protein